MAPASTAAAAGRCFDSRGNECTLAQFSAAHNSRQRKLAVDSREMKARKNLDALRGTLADEDREQAEAEEAAWRQAQRDADRDDQGEPPCASEADQAPGAGETYGEDVS